MKRVLAVSLRRRGQYLLRRRGGIAGDAGVEAVGEAAHHGRIFVQELRHDREVIVVDDGVDAPVETVEPGLDGSCDRVDVGAAAQRKALQIDEEQVLLPIKRETPILRRQAISRSAAQMPGES
jgi:hypothetical protein